MMDDKVVLVDTNVLLSATAPLRTLHPVALRVLNEWPNQGVILATYPLGASSPPQVRAGTPYGEYVAV